jgi:hypothetical protein
VLGRNIRIIGGNLSLNGTTTSCQSATCGGGLYLVGTTSAWSQIDVEGVNFAGNLCRGIANDIAGGDVKFIGNIFQGNGCWGIDSFAAAQPRILISDNTFNGNATATNSGGIRINTTETDIDIHDNMLTNDVETGQNNNEVQVTGVAARVNIHDNKAYSSVSNTGASFYVEGAATDVQVSNNTCSNSTASAICVEVAGASGTVTGTRGNSATLVDFTSAATNQIARDNVGSGTTLYTNAAAATANIAIYRANPQVVGVDASASTVTIDSVGTTQYIENNGALAALTVKWPATPWDGETACFKSAGAITALTTEANTGQTMSNALSASALTAGTNVCYTYSAANTNWF